MNIETISKKAIKSVITLTSKTVFLNMVNFAGAFFLTIFLSPSDFGVFILVSTFIDILQYFSDIGLAGALIQKKTKLEDDEINTTFTVQMLLILTGILIAGSLSGLVKNSYNLDETGIWLFYALLASFFISSLKSIPTVLSERKLEYNKVVIPQYIETIIYNFLIVILAWKGYGLISYIWAVLSRAIFGTVTIYWLVKWKPKLCFNFVSIKNLLKFGVPFQVNSLIAVVKDKFSFLILGKILGTQGLGMLGWAEKYASMPLRYFLDGMVKVSFPLFSRLQDNLTKAKDALEKSIYFISVLIFPSLAFSYLAMPFIIEIVPKYQKWEPAILTFNLFLISAVISAVTTFLSNFLTAIGKIKQVMGLMIMWTVLTLFLYPFLAYKFGFEGVALASIMINMSSFIPYILVRKVVKINIVRQIYPSLLASAGMILGINYIKHLFVLNLVGLVYTGITASLIFGFIILLIDGRNLIYQIRKFFNYARNKSNN